MFNLFYYDDKFINLPFIVIDEYNDGKIFYYNKINEITVPHFNVYPCMVDIYMYVIYLILLILFE